MRKKKKEIKQTYKEMLGGLHASLSLVKVLKKSPKKYTKGHLR